MATLTGDGGGAALLIAAAFAAPPRQSPAAKGSQPINLT
jgi:hypothetical protein